ncbi:hypothetical protein GGQ88_003250 [Novosphingobium hassiacum]|uniref:Uncharacterized protein n=1 Tax=Novosphingobium hassiacum TaxID=173676 RepID=A0A7W6A2A1_9SPHN|nr:hypothetical protein [Novosphingobium hassiacum]MBB3861960.1 hypothetical protein [Novosphingobium hassiacum]
MAGFFDKLSGISLIPRALAGLACVALVSGCEVKAPAGDEPDEASTAIPTIRPPAPAPTLTLGPATRTEIVAAVASAADATAAGLPLPEANLTLANRTFELHLPFGCGPDAGSAWGQVRRDPSTSVLRVSVTPERFGQNQRIAATAAGEPFDAIEGFWIERPWTTAETCPKSAPSAPVQSTGNAPNPQPAAPQTLAIAQFFKPDAPRTSQRGNRPYTYVGKPDPADPALGGAMRLRLTGRISGFADGHPVHCHTSNPSAPPLCVVAVEFTGVGIEDVQSGKILTEWKY